MPHRVAVKICGVTDPGDALLSAELGADFLGLNFWPGSPRWVGLDQAREIAAAVRAAAPRVALVGVFVNAAAAFVEETAAAAGLDLLQFSGDEPAAAVRPFAARAIKALRTHDPRAAADFADCWGVLFDAPRLGGSAGAGAPGRGGPGAGLSPAAVAADPGAAPSGADATAVAQDYGGTGRQWDYGAVASMLGDVEGSTGTADSPGTAAAAAGAPGTAGATDGRRRVFLAGGLRPDNVRRVVATLRPFAVDVCSGVESAPGRKEPRLLRQLFEEVRNGQVDRPT
jgi:phosphoribosylanthranilate isomerase